MKAWLVRAWPLVALRLAGLGVALAPAVWLVRRALAASVGRVPSVAEAAAPLPLADVMSTARALPAGAAAAAAAGLMAFYLYDQTLAAAAVQHLAPGGTNRPGLWRTWRAVGLPLLPAYLRVGAVCAALLLAGAAAAGAAFEALDALGARAGWTGLRRVLEIPGVLLLATAVWGSSVGALGFWSRLLIAVGGQRRVRRVLRQVLAVIRRAPLRAWGVYTAVSLALQLLGGALLVRQAPDGSGAWRLFTFTIYLLLQSCAWLGMVAWGRAIVTSPSNSSPTSP